MMETNDEHLIQDTLNQIGALVLSALLYYYQDNEAAAENEMEEAMIYYRMIN